MIVDRVLIALLRWFSRTRPLARLLELIAYSEEVDRQIRGLEPGQSATVVIPEGMDLRFRSRSGKRFSLSAGVVQRMP